MLWLLATFSVILFGSSRCWGHCPSSERSPRTAGPAAPTTGVTRRENGDVSIESHPRNSAGKDTYSWPSRPHSQPERAAARSRPTKKIRTAGRTNPRPRPPSVSPAANGPRRPPSPVAAIRSIVPFASTPVGWNSRPGANGQRQSEPGGRRYRDVHPPGAPGPIVQHSYPTLDGAPCPARG